MSFVAAVILRFFADSYRYGLYFCVLCVLVAVSGCARQALVGEVEGTVTLDGEPVEKATVMFQPSQGATSYGETDGQGKFVLRQSGDRPGVLVGTHKVTVETYRIHTSSEGEPVVIPETIPAKYNANSELTRDVKPGKQIIDFDLIRPR